MGRALACLGGLHRIDCMSVFGARSAIAWAFALAALHAAQGQRPRLTIGQLEHAVWTVQDGAPLFINSLAQTTDGMLWIASTTGLYRFDGLRFERFEPPAAQSFPSLAIAEISALPDNSLWIWFVSGGVSMLSHGRGRSTTADVTAYLGEGSPESRAIPRAKPGSRA